MPVTASDRPPRWRVAARCQATALVAALVTAALAGCTGTPAGPGADQDFSTRASTGASLGAQRPGAVDAQTAALLAASTDLGPSVAPDVEALLALPAASRPSTLYGWAARRDLRVGWHAGESWALVHGPAAEMSVGFRVPIHDFRARSGTRFYAAERVAAVPGALRGAVTGVGSILSYVPRPHVATPPILDHVPPGGLTAAQLLRAYDAAPLSSAGYTGKGATVVFFELDGYRQSDLNAFAQQAGLSPINPTLDSGQPGGKADGQETPMDLEVVHALVPDAKLVVFDVLPYLRGSSIADISANIGTMYRTVDHKYPGAIWSLSIGVGCDKTFTAADMQPQQAALQTALAHGTSAFISSGDTGGLECKSGEDFGDPPTGADYGVNGISQPPAITVVGGTALSTDANGGWVGEQTWTSSALQQGTGGGVAPDFPRPSWQQAAGIDTITPNTVRLTPDVAADADPATGVRIFVEGKASQGGGTSQAAPIWAGLTVMWNAYLKAHGAQALGDINPLLYRAAARTPKAFHDVTLGGNSVASAQPGFDLVTGLGTPDAAVLAGALLSAKGGGA